MGFGAPGSMQQERQTQAPKSESNLINWTESGAIHSLNKKEESRIQRHTKLVSRLEKIPFFIVSGESQSMLNGFYMPIEYMEKNHISPKIFKVKKWNPMVDPKTNYSGRDYLIDTNHTNVEIIELFPYYIVPSNVEEIIAKRKVMDIEFDRRAFIQEIISKRHKLHNLGTDLNTVDFIMLQSKSKFVALTWDEVVKLEKGHTDAPNIDIDGNVADSMGSIIKVLIEDESSGFISEYFTSMFD